MFINNSPLTRPRHLGQEGILSNFLQRRAHWTHIHLTLNPLAAVKSRFCFKCSFQGILKKCSTCWRSFHPACYQIVSRCVSCTTARTVDPGEEAREQIELMASEIAALPKLLADLYGFDIELNPLAARHIQLDRLLDMICYHKLVFGITNEQVQLTRQISTLKVTRSISKTHPKTSSKSSQTTVPPEDLMLTPGGHLTIIAKNHSKLNYPKTVTESMFNHWKLNFSNQDQIIGHRRQQRCLCCRRQAVCQTECCRMHAYCNGCYVQFGVANQCRRVLCTQSVTEKRKTVLTLFLMQKWKVKREKPDIRFKTYAFHFLHAKSTLVVRKPPVVGVLDDEHDNSPDSLGDSAGETLSD